MEEKVLMKTGCGTEKTDAPELRVAAVIGKMVHGGVESIVFSLARAMQQSGSPVAFDFYYDDDSTRLPPEDLIRGGARFFRIPRYQKPFAFLKTLVSAFKRERYLIVHSHLNTMSFLPLLAAKFAGVPVRIVHNHSTAHDGEGMKTTLKKMLRGPATWVATDKFACGEAAARWMYGEKAVTDGSVYVLLNGVDPEGFTFDAAARSAVRKEFGIPEATFVMGHIGRFTYAKNHARLIEIFAAAHRLNPDSRLILVGAGELEEGIRRLVSYAGLTDLVTFAGVRRDAGRLYSAFDAFVLPSFYEGLPVVGIEAQFNGVPCVFSAGITPEAAVNKNVSVLPLTETNEAFARVAMESKRCEPSTEMERFDIRTSAEKLERFYLDQAERCAAKR